MTTVVCLGCLAAPDGARPASAQSDQEPPTLSQEKVEQLMALGYLGYSDTAVDRDRQGVVIFDPRRSSPGYNLVTTRNSCMVELIDARGTRLHSWQYEPCHHWGNFVLLGNGDLVVPGVEAFASDDWDAWREAHALLRLSWDGKVVWKLPIPAHHDVTLVPDGRLLTLTERYHTLPAIHSSIEVRDNFLTLLSMEGEVLEELALSEMLSSEVPGFELTEVRPTNNRGHEEIDLFHVNSVEWMARPELERRHRIFAPGNVLISIRHQNAIAVVDWARKKVVWAWGQDELSGPHHAAVLDTGRIMVFDNGLRRKWSRVIEMDPVTGEIEWQYAAPSPTEFFTVTQGAHQRLANGNTLISNSNSGQVFEVTPAGEIVWEYLNPHLDDEGRRATIVRARRYDERFIDGLLK